MEEEKKEICLPIEWRLVIVGLVLSVMQTAVCAGQLLPKPITVPWVIELGTYPGGLCLLEFFSSLLTVMLAWRFYKKGFDDVREKKYTLPALISVLAAASFFVSVGVTAMVVRGFGDATLVIFDFTSLLSAFWMVWNNLKAMCGAQKPGAKPMLIAFSAFAVIVLGAVLYLHLK